MSLTFLGPQGDHEERWITYALLRDNVVHHLDRGRTDPDLSALYRVAEALGGKAVRLSAAQLRRAAERADARLRGLPIRELAISSLTLAVIGQIWPVPPGFETHLVEDRTALGGVPPHAETLGDVVGGLLTALDQITQGPLTTDATVEVLDG